MSARDSEISDKLSSYSQKPLQPAPGISRPFVPSAEQTGPVEELGDIDSEDDGDQVEPIEPVIQRTCECMQAGIGGALLHRLVSASKGNMQSKRQEAFGILETLITQNETRVYCRRHLTYLASQIGLLWNRLTRREIAGRLVGIWQHKDDFNTYIKSDETVGWWTRRTKVAVDELGVYAYQPTTITLTSIPDDVAEQLLDHILGPGSYEDFQRDGNLVIPGFFKFLYNGIRIGDKYESGIGDLIEQEFNMYLHHQGNRNGAPNNGWLRTMHYSLIQDLVRQDLFYWLVYVCLRPDHQARLVSYPYYTKFASNGDKTAFRHIDLNVNQLLESGKGSQIIQGSVSLDDELDNSCTEIVPGFQHRIRSWWADVVERGQACDGHITGLKERYNKADEEKYGTFVPVPCSKGDARITLPQIPHGATGTPRDTEKIRRTILPWYVAVDEDDEYLDNEESNTYAELVAGHQAQQPLDKTTSGLANKYGIPPHSSPASIPLRLSNPVSTALVCGLPWSSMEVKRMANELLSGDMDRITELCFAQRLESLRQYKSPFENMKRIELASCGKSSYFNI